MQTRKLGKGEGVSHGRPTREGNPGWGCFLARGVRPPVWVQGLRQLGVGTRQPSCGESRCLASHFCPLDLAGWEVEAGGERPHSRWREGRVDAWIGQALDLWQAGLQRTTPLTPQCSPMPG